MIALALFTRNVINVACGDYACITPDGIKIFNGMGRLVGKDLSSIIRDVRTAEKGGHEHFMMKEIPCFHAESYAAKELKHGTITWIEER